MALIPGKNTLSSGTGSWTVVVPSNVTIATDDPPTRNPFPDRGLVPDADLLLFPTVHLVFDLVNDDTVQVDIVGDDTTNSANPADSVGFTANFDIDVKNDTGHDISGLVFTLFNAQQEVPLKLVPGILEYGDTVNANYAYFTKIEPVSGETISLFSRDGLATTPTGAAASQIKLTGLIAAGATVHSVAVLHNTELVTGSTDFAFTVDDTAAPQTPPVIPPVIPPVVDPVIPPVVTPVIPGTVHFMISNQSTGQGSTSVGEPYTGPVAGLRDQFILTTADKMNVTAATPFCFIHTGSGDDAIDVSAVGGNNVLDGGTGSNFLVGGTGLDTFFLDDRNAAADIWSTITNFHSGDFATIWGLTQSNLAIEKVDGQGAGGFTGLTYHITGGGKPIASLTLAGFTTADLTNGRLSVSFGHTGDLPGVPGSDYMAVHGV